MMKISEKSECSGCGACMNICPADAISLVPDDEGFRYPQFDNDKCIKCGKCVQVCPISDTKKIIEDNKCAYAAQTRNEQIRNNSSSGGVFFEIAAYVIKKGGVVFGAAFDKRFCVKHTHVEKIEELDKLMGSKYIQSEMGFSFRQVKKYLKEGRLVLFTGTPCQIGGLYSYLNKKYDNLLTQDIICHGVPSPFVWIEYVKFREKEAKSKIKHIFMRNKKYGWKKYSVQFEFKNCIEYVKTLREDLYMNSFLKNESLRHSCYDCKFKLKIRQSDITLADFWGIENVCPEIDDDKGTSLVITNSETGCKFFDMIKENLKYYDVDFEQAIQYNSAMTKSVPKPENRDKFISDVLTQGFEYIKKNNKEKVIYKIKRIVKKIIKKLF